MTTDFHNQAVDLAEAAFILRSKGEIAASKELFRQAFVLEQKAAANLPTTHDSEPSRSVLYRSAASMAFNADDFETAERLVANGLAGFPPLDIRDELQNLFEDINFMRHLEIKGLELDDSQWLMSLSGNATSHGRALVGHLVGRVEKVATIFYRTVARMKRLPFSETIDKQIKERYGLYINAFVPRSFGVTFQVGMPDPQAQLFPDSIDEIEIPPSEVIEEVMSCLEILEGFQPSVLKERIPDQDYFQNFVGLAKQIAPDGDDIKLVGFNYFGHGVERPVALRKSREQIRSTAELYKTEQPSDDRRVRLSGLLNFANSPARRGKFGTVQLTDRETGTHHKIKVPRGLMKDVVQPYFEENVSILATAKENGLFLEEISPES